MRERRDRGFRRHRDAATCWRLSAALPAILPLLVGVALAKTTWRVLAPTAVVAAAGHDVPDSAPYPLPAKGSQTSTDDTSTADDDGSRTPAALRATDPRTLGDARGRVPVLLAWVLASRGIAEADGARRPSWGRDPPVPREAASSTPFSPRAPPGS